MRNALDRPFPAIRFSAWYLFLCGLPILAGGFDRLWSQPVETPQAWEAIPDAHARYAALPNLVTRQGNAGGGAVADFQSLIDLITNTIEPDTWQANGGRGVLGNFPAGIEVDPDGLMGRQALRPLQLESEPAVDPSPSRLRMISLPRLERALLARLLAGEPPTDTMWNLAGIERIEFIVADKDSGELILAGPADGSACGLTLDSLLEILRNPMDDDRSFGCSIDPRAENLQRAQAFIATSSQGAVPTHRREPWSQQLRDRMGRQMVTIRGVDPRSDAARILVAADHHMKLVGLGLAPSIPEVPSYVDALEPDAEGKLPPLDVLRWWFVLAYDSLEANPERTVFALRGPAAKVLCENEFLAEQGRRVHTGKADPANQRFARAFSRHLDELAERHPIYRRMQGLFDLAMAAALIREHQLMQHVGWQSHLLEWHSLPWREGVAAPSQVESVVRVRLVNRRTFVTAVSGGVDARPQELLGQIRSFENAYQAQEIATATRARQAYGVGGPWYWDASPDRLAPTHAN